jgi:hypothetical protein
VQEAATGVLLEIWSKNLAMDDLIGLLPQRPNKCFVVGPFAVPFLQ